MALTADGGIAGSVSGGCVENAVVEAALVALRSNQARLLRFSVADETAWSVGLTCGGSLEVFVQPLNLELLGAIETALLTDARVVLATVVGGIPETIGRTALLGEGGGVAGSLGNELDTTVFNLARRALEDGRSQRRLLEGSVDVFLEVTLPAPTLFIVGGVHVAVALVAFAHGLGYRVVVIDPRQAWANDTRFPAVDQLIQAWPEEALPQVRLSDSSAVVSLSHDPKIELPALKLALESQAFYVGALGSRATDAKRRALLSSAGVTADQLARLHAPIGLQIGADSPEEIALAIMAEIVSCSRRSDA
jgi:xanthine dehydrogenase accessory factor